MSFREITQMTLVRPFVLGFTEPIVFAWNIYIALVYGSAALCFAVYTVLDR
jgi:DHA1 family multidrug resistance protein-like MFS transporter